MNAEKSSPFQAAPENNFPSAVVRTTLKMKFFPHDKPHFLQPAHDHDPADVSNLTDLPYSVSGALPNEVRELLPAVREATSIVFASFSRLDDLLSQRLERLTTVPNEYRKRDGGEVQCK
jgi:hypothetical protein